MPPNNTAPVLKNYLGSATILFQTGDLPLFLPYVSIIRVWTKKEVSFGGIALLKKQCHGIWIAGMDFCVRNTGGTHYLFLKDTYVGIKQCRWSEYIKSNPNSDPDPGTTVCSLRSWSGPNILLAPFLIRAQHFANSDQDSGPTFSQYGFCLDWNTRTKILNTKLV